MHSKPWQLEVSWVGPWLHSAAFERPGSVAKALAVRPFDRVAPRMAAGVLAHRGIGGGGIHMGHLVVFDHMAPMAAATLRREQLLQPCVAQSCVVDILRRVVLMSTSESTDRLTLQIALWAKQTL